MTKKTNNWNWGEKERDAFLSIKTSLTTNPLLRYPDFTRDFIVYADASGFGIGAVLAQIQFIPPEKTDPPDINGEQEVVIAYTSRHLNERERTWNASEKECLAIVHALEKFRPYLYGRTFKVYTDHKPLESLMNKKDPHGRLARWAYEIQSYDMKVLHRPGQENQNADALSRAPLPTVGSVRISKFETEVKQEQIQIDWKTAQREDDYCKDIIKELERDSEIKTVNEQIAAEINENIQNIRQEGTEEIPNQQINSDEPRTRLRIRPASRRHTKIKQEFHFDKEGLLVTSEGKLVVPEAKRKEILKMNHDHMLAGHLGIAKSTMRIKRQYFWPGLNTDVKTYVTNCIVCAKRKAYGTTKAPLKPIPPVQKVWEQIAMDIVGPLTESNQGNKYILVLSDYATRFVMTIPMTDQKAYTIAEHLVGKIYTKFGPPERVLTDQGTNFQSDLIKKRVNQLFQIEPIRTTSYHPQTDGLVERFNRTLCDMLACYVNEEPEQWDKYLDFVTFAYNTSQQTSIDSCPFYLFFKREPVIPSNTTPSSDLNVFENDTDEYDRQWRRALNRSRELLEKVQEKQKKFYDEGSKLITYKVNDHVLLKAIKKPGKCNYRWLGPYRVNRKISDLNYEIILITDEPDLPEEEIKLIVHVNRLKLVTSTPNTRTEQSARPVIQKRRGRPPKAKAVETIASKRRGRPPKIAKQTLVTGKRPGRPRKVLNQTNSIKKKTGRPPKWTNRTSK